jgi:Bardet-Biedl syndrome 2 protein
VIEFRPAKFLNTNKEIIAMTTGKLDSLSNNEMLFIGSRTNLLAYDVENNKDIFDKEVSDGVNCLAFGTFSTVGEALIVSGGNCCITGFDIAADERFWTVTGDYASSIQFMDWDDDGEDELVVGSDDFSIRVFKNEEMIFDI